MALFHGAQGVTHVPGQAGSRHRPSTGPQQALRTTHLTQSPRAPGPPGRRPLSRGRPLGHLRDIVVHGLRDHAARHLLEVALQRVAGGDTLTLGAGPGEERLEPAELLGEFLFGGQRHDEQNLRDDRGLHLEAGFSGASGVREYMPTGWPDGSRTSAMAPAPPGRLKGNPGGMVPPSSFDVAQLASRSGTWT